jgi:hypothetical protein
MLATERISRSTPMSSRQSSQIAVIGIDIGKNFFHVVGLRQPGELASSQPYPCVSDVTGLSKRLINQKSATELG